MRAAEHPEHDDECDGGGGAVRYIQVYCKYHLLLRIPGEPRILDFPEVPKVPKILAVPGTAVHCTRRSSTLYQVH